MTLFNLSLPEGVYIAGEWNNWVPKQEDKMTKEEGSIYYFDLPVASLTFTDSIAWYKVIYIGSNESKISLTIPLWEDNLSSTVVRVYVDIDKLRDGYAVGVGDTEKAAGTWYCAGEFNNWSLTKMKEKIENGEKVYYLEVDYEMEKGEKVEYKIARNTDWKPYEEQFDGKKYNAGYAQNALYVATKSGSTLEIRFYPKYSILEAEIK